VEAAVDTGTKEVYRAKEFATLAGVTVRALHHYDRLGLLRPKQRSPAGYRLYTMRDFARLEQIVVLKFLGIPLKQIRRLLESESNLGETLQRQQEVLSEKRRQLEKAIRAIGNAQRALESRHEPDWKLFQLIVQEIEMQNRVEWKGKYFSPEAKAKVAERRAELSPEAEEKANRAWAELNAEIAASVEEDPAGEKAQALATRWLALVEEFTGGDPEILKGLQAMIADRANWPEDAQKGSAGNMEAARFIQKAVEVRKKGMGMVVGN
jgi:DNA-binding transcriptional MerR regulator